MTLPHLTAELDRTKNNSMKVETMKYIERNPRLVEEMNKTRQSDTFLKK